MLVWIGRAGSLLVALTTALVGALLIGGVWSAWDAIPPDGPPLNDASRTYEIVLAVFGLGLLSGGSWLAVRVARRMLHRTP